MWGRGGRPPFYWWYYSSSHVFQGETRCDCYFYEEPPPGREKPVKVWLDSLPASLRDKVYAKFDLLGLRGIEASIQCGLLKHVRGKIYEVKVKAGKGAQPRVLGWIERSSAGRQRFVAASAEMKDQPELDGATIALAEQRMESWNARRGT